MESLNIQKWFDAGLSISSIKDILIDKYDFSERAAEELVDEAICQKK